MKTFETKVRYADICILTIEAETLEEAQAKLDAGEFDEHTIDYYAEETLEHLKEKN